MKIVPSEFSNSAWSCFILAKEIAYKNHQQNIDSDNSFFTAGSDFIFFIISRNSGIPF